MNNHGYVAYQCLVGGFDDNRDNMNNRDSVGWRRDERDNKIR